MHTMYSIPTKPFIFLLLLLTLSEASANTALYDSERDDLLEIRDSLTSTLNLHSNWTGPPCYKNQSRWTGITCSNSHVVSLSLDGIQLTGSLHASSLQNLTYLTKLSLYDNTIHGDLPTLEGLLQLQFVSFSGNRFSGSIPSEYVTLPNLASLDLHDNLLNGGIPLFEQQSLVVFNVSFNFLQGRIPDSPVLQSFPATSFDHNLGLCGKPLDKVCPGPSPSPSYPPISPPPPPSPPRPSGTRITEFWGLILVAVCAVVIPIVIIFGYLCYYKRFHREASSGTNVSGDVPSDLIMEKASYAREGDGLNKLRGLEFFDKDVPAFDLDDLLRSSAELMGKGKVGTTYRATLESGAIVVVKRLKEMGGLSRKEFVQQMQILGRLKHENIVEIIAFYYSKDEKLIIYENAPDGSLFQILHENRGEGRLPLTWPSRLKITKGIARGLSYLHQSLPHNSQKLPHSNLKSSNVLITPSHHPKLTDFGFLPLLISPQQKARLAIRNTPEFTRGRKLLDYKADIYCFGLMLVEILTGQNPDEHEPGLGEWVRSAVSREWSTDVLDLEIVAEKDGHEEMFKLMEVALDCIALEPSRRPKMNELLDRIEGIQEVSNGEGSLQR